MAKLKCQIKLKVPMTNGPEDRGAGLVLFGI